MSLHKSNYKHFDKLACTFSILLGSNNTDVSTVGLWSCGFVSLDVQIYAFKFRRKSKNFSQKHLNLKGHLVTFCVTLDVYVYISKIGQGGWTLRTVWR